MLRTDIEWIKLNIKQCVLRLSFYIMLASMALFMYLLSCISTHNSRCVRVLMFCEDNTAGRDIADELVEEAPQGYDFAYADSYDELVSQVTTGEADCGMVFEAGIDRKLSEGNLKKAVTFYQYAGSTAGYIAREIVFPHILKRGSNGLLENYMDEQAEDVPEDIRDAVREANDSFVSEADINIFTMKEIDGPSTTAEEQVSHKGHLVLMVSVIITIIMVIEGEYDNRNYYKALKGSVRIRRKAEATMVRMILISIVLSGMSIVLL